jgi:hypothetical protein
VRLPGKAAMFNVLRKENESKLPAKRIRKEGSQVNLLEPYTRYRFTLVNGTEVELDINDTIDPLDEANKRGMEVYSFSWVRQ